MLTSEKSRANDDSLIKTEPFGLMGMFVDTSEMGLLLSLTAAISHFSVSFVCISIPPLAPWASQSTGKEKFPPSARCWTGPRHEGPLGQHVYKHLFSCCAISDDLPSFFREGCRVSEMDSDGRYILAGVL